MQRHLLAVITLILAGGAGFAQFSPGNQGGPPAAHDATAAYPQSWVDALESIALNHPDDAATRIRLARVLDEMDRPLQARRWWDEAARIDPAMTAANTPSPTAPQHAPFGTGDYPNIGPDVIVGNLSQVVRWGRADQITAYSIGTVACNAGDANIQWVASTNQHPVIAQHLYRMKDGRFEMIGQSWLKHGFIVVADSNCVGQFGYWCNGVGGSALGVGCSDVYSGGHNGAYQWLGPKHEVNASTGYFPYPHGNAPDNAPIGKRLQVHDDDLKPALNKGALYFIEGHYIAPDDAAAGNGLNNASYRRVDITESEPDIFEISFISQHPTQSERAAIFAWQDFDPAVVIHTADVPGDGRFILGYKVTDNGDGTWHYEYALHNFNSDRSGGSFSIPVAQELNVTDIGFHDVVWHSGAPYDDAPWTVTHDNGMLTWSTETYDENPDANALRWGTLYNFRFTADAPPAAANATVGLFKPADPESPTTAVFPAVRPQKILGDLDSNGLVDVSDLLALLSAWGPCPSACPSDLNTDGTTDVSDMLILLTNWG